MEGTKRFATLSTAEVETLRNQRRVASVVIVATVIMFLFFAAGAIWSGSSLYILLFFLITPIPMVVFWIGHFRRVRSLNADIRVGKKKIVIDRVESQRQDVIQRSEEPNSYTFLITVRGKELEVTETQYYKCKKGQLVEINIAPSSNHVFSVGAVQDAVTDVLP